jgi:hypothetical protein
VYAWVEHVRAALDAPPTVPAPAPQQANRPATCADASAGGATDASSVASSSAASSVAGAPPAASAPPAAAAPSSATTPPVTRWEFLDDSANGPRNWRPHAMSALLERHHERGEPACEFARGSIAYSCDLAARTQTNARTQTSRPLRRVVEGEVVYRFGGRHRPGAVWEFLDGDAPGPRVWRPHAQGDALEAAWARGADACEFTRGATAYAVDLTRDTQTDTRTRFVRSIRRREPAGAGGDDAKAASERQSGGGHLRDRAVSLDFLLRFAAEHDAWDEPTASVVTRVVQPATRASKAPYEWFAMRVASGLIPATTQTDLPKRASRRRTPRCSTRATTMSARSTSS